MKLKKAMLVTLVLLAILTIGAASAADDVSDDLAVSEDVDEVSIDSSVDDEVISEDSGDEVVASSEDDVTPYGNSSIGPVADVYNQEGLQFLIENTDEGDTLDLENDYTFTGPVSEGTSVGISINKSIIIDGHGHAIDANNFCTIFAIDAPNITLLSISFKNGCVGDDFTGGAIGGGNSGLTVINCTFYNNKAINTENAGAIAMIGDNVSIMNSVFMDNIGFNTGGAIVIRGNGARISDCHFRSNRVNGSDCRGGAICIEGEYGTISSCLFENHTADFGRDIYIKGPQDNFVIEDCSSDGGEVNIYFDESSAVDLWINTDDVFTTDDLSQIFATVTAPEGVQGNVIFASGDKGLYNTQLDEFDPSFIDENVYSIALGDDGQFIFDGLQSGDVFEFSFIMEGSEDAAAIKQYMIFFDDNAVRFEEYHDDADDGVIIYVEDGNECQYDLDLQDDAEASFAWVSVINDLEGRIAIFVYGEDEDKIYFFEKSLNDIEEKMADEENEGFTRYFIHLTDIDDLDKFKYNERFTLAFIDNEDNVVDSREYNVDYNDEENVIKFFEAGDDDKGEELDSVIIVGGNVITNDAIISIPENLSNDFDDEFEVILLMEGDEIPIPFKFSELESEEGFYHIRVLDLFTSEDVGEGMGVNLIVQFYKDSEKAAYAQPEDDEFGIQVYTSPFVNDAAYILENGWVVSFRGFENVDDEFTVTISQEGAADIVKTLKISEIEPSGDDYVFYELHLNDLEITEPGEYTIGVRFTLNGDELANNTGNVNVGKVLVRPHGPDAESGDPIVRDVSTRVFHIGVSEDIAGFARLFVDGVQVGEDISFTDLEFDDWPSHNGRQIYLNNYHITESGNYTLKVEVYDENGEFLAVCENYLQIEVGDNHVEFISGPYGSEGNIEFSISTPLEDGQYYNIYLNGKLAGTYNPATENKLEISDEFLDQYFEIKIFKPGTYDVNVTFFDGENETDFETGSFTIHALNLTSDKETYLFEVDSVLISFRLDEILEEYRLDAYYLNYWDRVQADESMVFNPYGDVDIRDELYNETSHLVTFDVAWFADPENPNYRLDLGTNYIHVTYKPWNGKGIAYGGIIAVNVVNSTEPTKEDPMINVTADSVVYGSDLVINIRSPDGVINITVNGKTYVVEIVDGVAILIINNLNAGTYIVTVDYAGDDKYNSYTNQTVVEVLKADSSFTMEKTVFDYSDEITFNYTLIGAEEFMGIAIGDYPEGEVPYAVPDEVGYLYGFTAGNFTVQFTTINPDENHNAIVVNYTIIINKVPSSVVVEDVTANYGETVTVVPVMEGATGFTASIVGYPDADVACLSDGEIVINDLKGGVYTLNVVTIPDGNHNAASANATITINKIDPSINLTDVVFDYGRFGTSTISAENGTVNVKDIYLLDSNDNVIAYIEVNDEPILDLKISFNDNVIRVSGLDAGEYTLKVTTVGDDNYSAAVVFAKVVVNKVNWDASLSDIVFDFNTTGTGTFVYRGNSTSQYSIVDILEYHLSISGDSVTVSGLNAGNYTLEVIIDGDNNHNKTVVTSTIVVNKVDSSFTMEETVFDYSDEITFNYTLIGAEEFEGIAIGDYPEGKEPYATCDDAGYLYGFTAGNFTVQFTTIPDENHNAVVVNYTITINKAASTIEINDSSVDYGKIATIPFAITGATGVNAILVENPDVYVYPMGDNAIGFNGNVDAGIYTLKVVTIPDENHYAVEANATVEIKKIDSTLNVSDVVFDYGKSGIAYISYSGILYVTASVVGYPDAIVDKQDTEIVIANLNAGSYTLSVITVPDKNHNSVEVNATVTVNKVDSSFALNATVFDYADEFNVTFSVEGAEDITPSIINNSEVDFVCDIENNVMTIYDLNAGTYILNVVLTPDENHNVAEVNIPIVVNKIDSSFEMEETVFDYSDEITFNYTLIGAKGFEGIAIGDYPEGEEPYATCDGVGYLNGFTAGNFTVQFTTIPDENHNAVVVNYTITINKVASTIEINDSSFDYRKAAYIPFVITGATEVNATIVERPWVEVYDLSGGKALGFDGVLPTGNFTLRVVTVPDENHYAVETTAKVTINKINSTVYVTDVVFNYGESGIANVYNSDGIRYINIASIVDHPEAIIQYTGYYGVIVSNLTVGTYTLLVITEPYDDFNPVEATANITVNKANSSIFVNDSEFDYGSDVTVPVECVGAIDFNASLVDYPDAEIEFLSDGIVIYNLASGNYTLKVATVPDENHNSVEATANIIVKKVESSITLDKTVFDYAEEIEVNFTLVGADNFDGDALDCPGASVSWDEVVYLRDFTAGTHVVQFTTVPDENHTAVVVNVTITINKLPSTVTVEDASALYGNPITVPVNFTNAIGVNATIVDYLDANITYTADAIVINGLAVGNYTLRVVTVVDENHAVAVDTAAITVNEKPALTLNVTADDITFGEDLVAVVSSGSDVEVYFMFDNDESSLIMIQIENGLCVWTLEGINAGNHVITVRFPGDENYTETVASTNVTVNKADSSVDVEDASALYGETILVPVSFTGAEGINASVVDCPDANVVCTADGILIDGLVAGNYTLKVVTIVDDNHNADEATANIYVNRAIVTSDNLNEYFTEDGKLKKELLELVFTGNFASKTFNIDKAVSIIGENAKLTNVQFNIRSDNVAIINMEFNNNELNPVISVDGVSNFTLENNAITFYAASDKVSVVLVNNSDNVVIRDNSISASGRDFVDGIIISDSNFTVSSNTISVSTSDTAEGIHIMGSSSGNVTGNHVDVIANRTVFGFNTSAIFNIYNMGIVFASNVIYGEAIYAVGIHDDSESVNFNKVTLKAYQAIGVIVNSENADVSHNNIKLICAEPDPQSPTVPCCATGVQVNIKCSVSHNEIDSFDNAITVEEGCATDVSYNTANAPIVVSSAGTNIVGNDIVTDKGKAVIISQNAVDTVVDGNLLSANGGNGDGAISNEGTGTTIKNNKAVLQLAVDPIADVFEGQGVVIVITADKNFTGNVKLQVGNTNTTLSLNNGSGKYDVVADKLAVGEVLVKVTFDGDDKYSNDTANTTFTVKAKVATSIKATAVTTTYGTSKNIVVTLKDANGNVLVGKNVTVVLNGAKKVLTTNDKGQVSYPVGGKLAVKTHMATITFDGDTQYVKATGTAKVVVKKATPKLTAKKKTFKVKKSKKYTVVLKTDKGKALNNVKVTITIKAKGKKIKITKATKKGKATFNLKKLTKKGKYTAKVKVAGNKNYNAVTKKAKIKIK